MQAPRPRTQDGNSRCNGAGGQVAARHCEGRPATQRVFAANLPQQPKPDWAYKRLRKALSAAGSPQVCPQPRPTLVARAGGGNNRTSCVGAWPCIFSATARHHAKRDSIQKGRPSGSRGRSAWFEPLHGGSAPTPQLSKSWPDSQGRAPCPALAWSSGRSRADVGQAGWCRRVPPSPTPATHFRFSLLSPRTATPRLHSAFSLTCFRSIELPGIFDRAVAVVNEAFQAMNDAASTYLVDTSRLQWLGDVATARLVQWYTAILLSNAAGSQVPKQAKGSIAVASLPISD